MVKGQDAPKPVGSFATGKTALTGAPSFVGIAKASYYKAVPVCCMCMTDDPYAVIELKDKIADNRMAQIRYAVWMSDAAGKIDYRKPPATIYYGSDRSTRQIQEVSEAFQEAHELGMFTVLWAYLRNSAFKKEGKDFHAAAD